MCENCVCLKFTKDDYKDLYVPNPCLFHFVYERFTRAHQNGFLEFQQNRIYQQLSSGGGGTPPYKLRYVSCYTRKSVHITAGLHEQGNIREFIT